MEEIYFVICSCMVFACFPVVSDDCCVHNFVVAPSTLLLLSIPSFFPLIFKFPGDSFVVGEEGKQPPLPRSEGNPWLQFFVAEPKTQTEE